MNKSLTAKLPNINKALLSRPETGAWDGIVQKINPIAVLSDAYSRTLEYRRECKLIKAELERICEQAKLAHTYLDNTLKERMATLEQRQSELQIYLQAYGGEQDERRHNRQELMRNRSAIVSALLSQDVPLEHKQVLAQVLSDIGKHIADVDDKAQQSLGILLQTLSQRPQLPGASTIPFLNWQNQGE